MTDIHETAPPQKTAAGAGAEDAPRRDNPFAGRRSIQDADLPSGSPGTSEGGVAGERGISPVAGRFSSPQAKMAGVAAMIGGAALLVSLTWKHGDARAEGPKEPARQVVRYDEVAATPPPLPPAPTSGGAGAVDPLTGRPLASGQAPPDGDGAADAQHPSGGQTHESLADLTRRAPLMAYNQSSRGLEGAAQSLGAAISDQPGAQAPARQQTELENLRRGSAITRARATSLGDRSYMILAGAQIPCALQTAMDSSLPGYTTCIIPHDVYSDNGRVVLLERGTKVLGEYRGGMQRGQRRLFVLWTRAVTPQGIAIDLASPAADSLGRAGFSGDLDNRFFERFGGALLLSLVDDGIYAATQGNGRDFQNTIRVPSDAAGIALQHSINLPPVLRKNQGEDVTIMVAQDFDFSDVYGVQAR